MYLLPLQAALGKKDENVLEMICSYVVHSPVFNPLLVPLPSTTASCPAHLCEQPAPCGYPYSSGDLSAEELSGGSVSLPNSPGAAASHPVEFHSFPFQRACKTHPVPNSQQPVNSLGLQLCGLCTFL